MASNSRIHRRKKILIRVVVFLIIAISAKGYLGFQARRQYVVSRETTFFLGPVAPNGRIDFNAVLDDRAAAGVTPETNAATLLLTILEPAAIPDNEVNEFYFRLGMDKPTTKVRPLEIRLRDDERYTYYLERPWGEFEYPEVVDVLQRNSASLEIIRQASFRPRLYFPSNLPSQQHRLLSSPDCILAIRRLIDEIYRQLTARALLRAYQGDPAGCIDDLRTIRRLGVLASQLSQTPFWQYGCFLHNRATSIIARLARDGYLRRLDIMTMLSDINVSPFLNGPSELFDLGQRSEWLKLFTLLYDHSDVYFEVVVEPALPLDTSISVKQQVRKSYMATNWIGLMRLTNRRFSTLAPILRENPGPSRRAKLNAQIELIKSEESESDNMLFSLYSCFLPTDISEPWRTSVDQVATNSIRLVEIEDHHRCLNELGKLSLLLALYKLNKGEFPERLDALVPEMLPSVPLDPMSEKPFIYRRTNNSFVLYSLGINGTDDSFSNDPDCSRLRSDDVSFE